MSGSWYDVQDSARGGETSWVTPVAEILRREQPPRAMSYEEQVRRAEDEMSAIRTQFAVSRVAARARRSDARHRRDGRPRTAGQAMAPAWRRAALLGELAELEEMEALANARVQRMVDADPGSVISRARRAAHASAVASSATVGYESRPAGGSGVASMSRSERAAWERGYAQAFPAEITRSAVTPFRLG